MCGDQTGLPDRIDRGEFAAHVGDSNWAAKNAGGGGSTKADHDLRLNQLNLHFQPRTAGLDFSRGGFFMQSALPGRFPLKMFHRVRHITEIPLNLRRFERAIQQSAGRPHKWQPSSIFNVTGLLAHEKDARLTGSGPENSLDCSLPK